MKTTGNTVLITGGGSGIGLALAEAFWTARNTVIITGRNIEKLHEAKSRYPDMHAVQADVTVERDRQRLAGEIQERFPALNILVNNAGVAYFSELRTDPDLYEKIRLETETNFLAPVRFTQLFLGSLGQRPSAAVINISTVAVCLPLTIMPGYSASKAALHSFTRSLRLQLSGTPVKVFEVLPPAVDTDMVQGFQVQKLKPEQIAEKVLEGVKRDCYEIFIGKANIVRWMARLAPRFCESAFHKQLLKATKAPDSKV